MGQHRLPDHEVIKTMGFYCAFNYHQSRGHRTDLLSPLFNSPNHRFRGDYACSEVACTDLDIRPPHSLGARCDVLGA